MKDINLLPVEYLQSNEIKKLSKLIAACAAIIFLFMILIVTMLSLANSLIEREILQHEILFMDPKFAESDEAQKELQRREGRLRSNEIISAEVKNVVNIKPKVIASVLGEAPKGVFALSVSADNVSRRIIFEGVTKNRDLIVEYVERLNALGIFENVGLSKVSAGGASKGQNEFLLELVLEE